MIEAEWWDADDSAELAASAAGDIQFIIESAIDARGQALIAVPGGGVALVVLAEVAKAKLDWKRVTVVPTGDCIVPVDSPLSAAAALARIFLPKGARVLPIGSDNADYKAAGRAADARLQDLQWPPDLVWLDVGANGETAGIFRGPDLDEALNGPKARRAIGVMPDPMPKDAPHARVTLTRAAIVSARTLIVALEGDAAKALLEKALEDGPLSDTPIGRVLAEVTVPVDIHWCPA
ncbi:6-phosphogluconolactonase [Sphingosinicella microcystinivorans]|uniref:6-phosphogluconolactonase n=1 Tax=Sphingosinicella microcystinivorans TaxID=335406 RepID=UPI0022F37F8B|nr:6-phosphogluconolactonase [Sphingosinicella microcystinivorans]WBX83534.1 6-phosphogluconolactonase [Sphingosinicella microcystinivorans]